MANFTVDQDKDDFMKAQGDPASRIALGADFAVNLAEDFSDIDPTGNNDSTAGLNLALAQLQNANQPGFLRDGHYRLSGTLNVRTNSLLTLPEDSGYQFWGGVKSIWLIGQSKGELQENGQTYRSGVVLDASDHPATAGTLPSIFAGAPFAAVNPFDKTDWQRTRIHLDRLLFLTEPDPTICGINGSNMEGLSIGSDVSVVATNVTGTASPLGYAFEEPTHSGIVGIHFPQTNNNIWTQMGGAFVGGFYDGVRVAEHWQASLRPWIGYCKNGVRILQGWHPIGGTVCIEHCNNLVVVDSLATQAVLKNFFVEGEALTGSEWWALDNILVDVNNVLRGRFEYSVPSFTGGGHYLDILADSLMVGGTNVDIYNAALSLGVNFNTLEIRNPESGTAIIVDDASGNATMAGRTPTPTNTPGNTWVVASGTWATLGGFFQQTAITASNLVAWVDSELPNATVGVDVVVDVSGISAGVAFRGVDANNFWVAILSSGPSSAIIYSVTAGTPTELNNQSISVTGTARVIVTDDGSNVRMYVNGAKVAEVLADTTHATGTFQGLYNFGAAAPLAQQYDNFQVTQP